MPEMASRDDHNSKEAPGGHAKPSGQLATSAPAVVAQTSSTLEGQLIVGMLKAHGLAATILGDDAGGQHPQWQLTDGVRVIVAARDAAAAQALLADVQ